MARVPETAPAEHAKALRTDALEEPVVDGPGPCIEVEVTANGAPVAGALVRAAYAPDESDEPERSVGRLGASGRARSWCNPGKYALVVEAQGFAPAFLEVEVKPGGKDLRLPFELQPGHTLRGFAFDEETRQPVAEAWVRLVMTSTRDARPEFPPVRSDAQGAFQVSHLPAGLYSFEAVAKGYVVTSGHNLRVPSQKPLDIAFVGTSRLEGQVVDGATGAPVAGARVSASQSGDSVDSELTDEQGRFALMVGAGEYHLSAKAGDRAGAYPGKVEVARGSQLGELVIRVGATGRIAGKVFALSDRQPMKGASVTILHVDSGWSTSPLTNTEGAFHMEHLPAGRYEVSALSEGFAKAKRGGLQLEAGRDLTVELAVARLASLTGTVTDALGRPASRARISSMFLDEPSDPDSTDYVLTDTQGQYTLEQLPPGRYRLEALHLSEGEPVVRELTLAEGEKARADFTLKEAVGQIEGTVQRAGGGLPLHLVSIGTISEPHSSTDWTLVDAKGRFTLVLRPGTYKLVATYFDVDEEDPAGRQVTVEAGKTVQVTLTVPDVVTETTGLVLAPNGAPAPGASVTFSNDELELNQETDERGHFTLKSSQKSAGALMTLTARRGPEHVVVPGVRLGSRDVVVHLLRPASLSGRVTARAGAPVKGFVLSVSHADTADVVFTDRSFVGETFTLKALPVGPLELVVRTTDGRSGKAQVRLEAGETGEVELQVGSLGRVMGRLVDASGVPYEGWVSVDPEKEESRSAGAAENGRFEIFAIEPGPHLLEFTLPDSQGEDEGGEYRTIPFTLRPGETLELGDLGPNTPATRE
jgi:hypothetical protein